MATNKRLFFLALFFFVAIQIFPQYRGFERLEYCENTSDSIKALCKIVWDHEVPNRKDAYPLAKKAIKIAEKFGNPSLIGDSYDALAVVCKDLDSIAIAKKHFEYALQMAIRGNDSLGIAWRYNHLAKIARSQDDFVKGGDYAKKAFTWFEQIGMGRMALDSYWMLTYKNRKQYADTLLIITNKFLENTDNVNDKLFYYLDLVFINNLLDKRKEAMHYVQLAMELAERNENIKGIINAYKQIAFYFNYYQHNYETALEYYQKILDIQEYACIPSITGSYINVGEMHMKLGKDSLALLYLKKALNYGEQNENQHSIALAYKSLGNYFYDIQEYNNALGNYLKCYTTGCNHCPDVSFHDALIKIGNVYLHTKDYELAKEFYEKSYNLADSSFETSLQSISLGKIGEVYYNQNKLSKSIETYEHALKLARKVDFLEGEQSTSERLSQLYEVQGNLKKALSLKKQSHLLSDSIEKNNEISDLAKLETYFEFKNMQEQSKSEMLVANQAIQKQKLIRNFFIIGFLLVSAIGLLIFKFYRLKRNDNILLKQQKHEIEQMGKKVHVADKAKLEFYTNVSHELRTPLTIIIGTINSFKAQLSHLSNSKAQIETMYKNALKLLSLINQLLDLRKLDTSNMALQVKEGNLNNFTSGILNSFDQYAGKKEMSFSFLPLQNHITAFFDHDKLEKILSNLISNAIKYSDNEINIEISLQREKNEMISIKVKDNGIGINESEQKKVFDRFYRTSDSSVQGSGIGLALVKDLVELHKGEIQLSSIKNKGSVFTVTIPIEKHCFAESELEKVETPKEAFSYPDLLDLDESSKMVQPANTSEDAKTILIIEDNTDLSIFIHDLFKSEYNTLCAYDGIEGLQLAKSHVPDIIISDVMMPKMNGIQLLEKLKSDAATSHIPVIILTAKNDVATQLGGFEKGADDYINKPFDSMVLKSRVENLLRLRMHLVEKFSTQFQLQPRAITIENTDQKFLQKAIDTIEAHIADENLNVELLAMELAVSKTQLYRKLKALTNYSANQFIRIIRLKRAANILEQGQQNIAEVMDATGFSNYSYFNNCFKEYFGEFPKDYVLTKVSGSLN